MSSIRISHNKDEVLIVVNGESKDIVIVLGHESFSKAFREQVDCEMRPIEPE